MRARYRPTCHLSNYARSVADETNALRFEGSCAENIIEELAVDGLEADFMSCETSCVEHGGCAGFSFSNEGCFPHSKSCLTVLEEKETGAWYYHLGASKPHKAQ